MAKEKMVTLRHSETEGLLQVQQIILEKYGMQVSMQQTLNFLVHQFLKSSKE